MNQINDVPGNVEDIVIEEELNGETIKSYVGLDLGKNYIQRRNHYTFAIKSIKSDPNKNNLSFLNYNFGIISSKSNESNDINDINNNNTIDHGIVNTNTTNYNNATTTINRTITEEDEEKEIELHEANENHLNDTNTNTKDLINELIQDNDKNIIKEFINENTNKSNPLELITPTTNELIDTSNTLTQLPINPTTNHNSKTLTGDNIDITSNDFTTNNVSNDFITNNNLSTNNTNHIGNNNTHHSHYSLPCCNNFEDTKHIIDCNTCKNKYHIHCLNNFKNYSSHLIELLNTHKDQPDKLNQLKFSCPICKSRRDFPEQYNSLNEQEIRARLRLSKEQQLKHSMKELASIKPVNLWLKLSIHGEMPGKHD